MAKTFDIEGLNNNVLELAQSIGRQLGVTGAAVLRDVMRLWMSDLMKKHGGDPKLSLAGQKRQLDGAVKRDINRVFNVIDTRKWETYDGRVNNGRVWIRNKQDKKKYFSITPDRYKIGSSIQTLEQEHNSHRVGGKVRHSVRNELQWVISSGDYRAYSAYKVGHVGQMKAGWLPGADYFKAKEPVKWIARHRPLGWGSYIDTLDNNVGDIQDLAAINKCYYAKDLDRTVYKTGETRIKDLQEFYVKRVNKEMQHILNKKRAA